MYKGGGLDSPPNPDRSKKVSKLFPKSLTFWDVRNVPRTPASNRSYSKRDLKVKINISVATKIEQNDLSGPILSYTIDLLIQSYRCFIIQLIFPT